MEGQQGKRMKKLSQLDERRDNSSSLGMDTGFNETSLVLDINRFTCTNDPSLTRRYVVFLWQCLEDGCK